jgi:6-phospho-beta-glucosidase
MKITIVGGAGVRTPLLMSALARRQEQIDLKGVTLVDLDESKLAVMGPLCRFVAERAGASFVLNWTSDAREALPGSDAVITTVRVGGEDARVLDERIALDRGVLGQETTGPGGFAMSLRTIPAVSHYAEMMSELCPDAWLLNFTNPAGLVAQALSTGFPDLKVVGICDTPTGMRRRVAGVFGRSADQVPVQFFGLNHLSWMAQALVDGENVVPRVIGNVGLAHRIPELALFDQDLLRIVGMLPNEYLYFYYYREQAVEHIVAAGETRGEQVRRLSGDLLGDLRRIDPATHPEQAWQRYTAYLESRHGTYMAAETASAGMHAEEEQEEKPKENGEEGEGYAGVALDILGASQGQPREIVANVPNRGAIPGMQDDDVVEVACRSDQTGLHPIPMESVPEDALLLMQQVKRYERLTVEAVRTHSRECAVEALMNHPLVGSYSLSRSLVDAYLDAHRAYVGEWAA